MRMQKLVRIRRNFPDRGIADVSAAVRGEMEASDWANRVPAGSRIAVGVGSRGIRNIAVIVKAAADYWKSRGVKPFIVPVMGSHGAATAEGQAAVLAHYGITESSMGAPVVSSLDVVPIGRTGEGIDVSMDRNAFESDGVMLCSRVKWHTDFEGALESGIHKMMAIGLGKWEGAKRYHCWAVRIGMEAVIRSVGETVIDTGKMLGGLAIMEDAHHNTAEVRALGVEGMAEREAELLARVKSWKANIPAAGVDFLIVDEIGKEISGAGMDTKVVNRSVDLGPNRWSGVPRVGRIFVRGLSPLSYGNAVGMGMADVANDRLLESVNLEATWVNSLTASTTQPGFTPIHFPTDRECIERVLPTCGHLDTRDCSIVWMRNTMRLGDLMVSENLLPELRGNPEIEIVGDARPLPFDDGGNLVSPFAAAAR